MRFNHLMKFIKIWHYFPACTGLPHAQATHMLCERAVGFRLQAQTSIVKLEQDLKETKRCVILNVCHSFSKMAN